MTKYMFQFKTSTPWHLSPHLIYNITGVLIKIYFFKNSFEKEGKFAKRVKKSLNLRLICDSVKNYIISQCTDAI